MSEKSPGPHIDQRQPTVPREPIIKDWQGISPRTPLTNPAVGHGVISEPQIKFPQEQK